MPQNPERRVACARAARAAGRRWRGYLAILATAAAVVVAISTVPELPLHHNYLGVVLGAIAMMAAISLVGLPSPARDGRFAEQWSFLGVRRVRGWYVTDEIAFDREAVDHVIVAPAAVLAVTTRFCARAAAGDDQARAQHKRDLHSASRAAQKVRLLMRAEQLRDAAPVLPVLVLWGPGAPALPEGSRIEDGVHLIDGDHPELWMHLFNAPDLAPALRRDLYLRFARIAGRRAAAPALPPLRRELWREFRGGMSDERSQRAERPRHGLRPRAHMNLAPAPGPAGVPPARPVAAGVTQGTSAQR